MSVKGSSLMVQGIRNLTYKNRLKHLNLHSLERRRVRRDLIEVFKLVSTGWP